MPLVNIMVNGRAYTVACDDGEEDHLRELALTVDAKAREVLSSVGQVGDTRLLLMAALLMADEHHAALSRVGAGKAGENAPEKRAAKAEAAAADRLEQAAARVEKIAARLAGA